MNRHARRAAAAAKSRQQSGFTKEQVEAFKDRQNETVQDMANTHAIYDRFQKLADYIDTDASEDEVKGFLEALSPVNEAICRRLNIEPAARVEIESQRGKL